MPYTTEEGGRLNNFAAEPKVYEAQPPSPSQQRNYIIMGNCGPVVNRWLTYCCCLCFLQCWC